MAANKKISQLTELTTVETTDVLPVVDLSANETKKVTKANLLKELQAEVDDVVADLAALQTEVDDLDFPVDSVNGQTGVVVLTTTNIAEGTNLYWTPARFDTAFAAKSTTNLAEGTNLYYTPARFDTAFAAKSTTNLAEGSNLYYTDERVDDRVAALLQNGGGITWTYNDGSGTLTPAVSLASFSTTNLAEGSNLYYTDERVDDRVAALIQNGTGITWSYNDGSGTLTPTVTITQYTDEMARDALGTALTAGTGITITPNDGADTITIATTITQYTDELAQDAIAAAFAAGTHTAITVTYSDASNSLSLALVTSGNWTGTFDGQEGTYYLARANHTGTQLASTISDFAEAVDDRIAALIVEGTGIDVTYDDTANTLTIATTGLSFPWTEVTGTSQAAAVNNGYITNNAALVTVTIPTTAAVGDRVRVAGKGAGGWRIAQNASEKIYFGDQVTTTGTGGHLDSTDTHDTVELLCIVANTEWMVIGSIGNISIT